MSTKRRIICVGIVTGLLGLARSSLAQPYDQMPPVVKIGQAASIAAWPPPHEIANDKRILETLTREIYLQEGDEFGVVDSKNNPLHPVPTSDWWTDVIMNGDGGTLWQYPLVPKISPNFIDVRVVGGLRAGSNGGAREAVSPVRIGAWNGQDAAANAGESPFVALTKARAQRWSDWMFAFRKTDSADPKRFVDVTLARSMPYAWFEFTGTDALVSFDDKSKVSFLDASGQELDAKTLGTRDTLVVRVDDKLYGLFLPQPAALRALPGTGGVVVSLSPDQRHVVLAALPSIEQLPVFAKCAFAKPIKTTVDYKYDPTDPTNAVRTTWSYQVQALRPGADTVLQGWLAPHYRGTVHDFTLINGADFETPRGKLRCATALATKGFSIDYPFTGIPSHLAAPKSSGLTNDFDQEYVKNLLLKYDAGSDGVAGDTYFGAKRLVLHARAMQMAKDLGMTETYQNLKQEIQASLADWFTYEDGKENHYFARNDRWGSLIGFNFVHDFNLGRFTDIHFHYGYYTLAFAYVAMDDPEFRDKYKDLVIEIAKAYAEWDRSSKRYPWMRTFEPMVGHSYAAGASSPGGNNQESSSESIQAWAGLFMLGEALRGNDPRAAEIMAAGAFGYAIETRAVLEYYQDYHGSPYASAPLDFDNKPADGDKRYGVWPDEYRYGRSVRNYPDKKAPVFTNGIMGDSGNVFGTYFGAQPEYIYGIQWLPNAPHMMFLARDPKFTLGQFTALVGERDKHLASQWMGALESSPRSLRNEWWKKPSDRNPDPRLWSIDNPWSATDMKGIVQNLFRLNPAFVKNISHEGDPVRDNPLYDEKESKWLVNFPADRPNEVAFPKEIWNPETLLSKYPYLVPPQNEKELDGYSLAVWATKAFLPPVGPGVDWDTLAKNMAWHPTDYAATPEGRKNSVAQLTTALESIGGSWPLIALTFVGFADPELGIDVMAESRKRNNAFANHTETGLFAYYYFYSLRGLGTPVLDQHVSIPSSIVLRDTKTGVTSYVVHNKSDKIETADVFDGTKKIGQVLAAPRTVTVQKGLVPPAR